MVRPAIETRALSKSYRPVSGWLRRGPERTAVADVDLRVEAGELFVLLGRNGAGKTTLVKILTTLVLQSAGEARIFGHDVARDGNAVRRLIGFASSDERSFFWRLSGRRNLEFWGALHDLRGRALKARIGELAAACGLEELLDLRFHAFSSGMKQRLAIARALIGNPRLVFLDEPTRSLDPTAARELRALIRELVSVHGLTVVLVTHQLEECRELAARYGLMRDGRLSLYETAATDPAELF
jgi:ABC-2 type transport system ATP-binding protein